MGVTRHGGHTFLTASRIAWGPLFPKNTGLGFWDGWGRGLGLGENAISLGFPERFPTFMGLRKPKQERMGPPDVAKVGLQGKPTGILSDRFFHDPQGSPQWAHGQLSGSWAL